MTMKDSKDQKPRQNNVAKFLGEYGALLMKMFLLTKRKRGQTIVEILLAYLFLALLLTMRYLLTRPYKPPFQIPPFYPHETMLLNSTTANMTYYYPNNPCTTTIMTNAMNKVVQHLIGFPNNVEVIPNPMISSLPNSTIDTIYAYIHFTNINSSCTNSSFMPDQIQYTLRMQENGLNYYRAQQVKLNDNDILWKRAPEDICQDNTTWVNYTTQFLGVQYFVDLSIIEYVTNINQSESSVRMKHFGCPEVYLDLLHGGFSLFVPLFYSIIYLVTFILNVGYIVEERANKTKEYLRIFGLRTWVNNLVWITRSMCVYFILTCITTGLSVVSLSSDQKKAVFNYVHWTVIWTILFVYSIQVSAFAVFFGQFFKRVLLAKLLGIVLWIVTFIDFYAGVSIGVRYFLCFFPNTGLLFCIQVMQQFERRSNGMLRYNELYWNIFDYPFYVGLYLCCMLIYSILYIFLAIYIERINPGEFGVAQSWNYLFKKSYWKPRTIQSLEFQEDSSAIENHWIEMNSREKKKLSPALTIDHLTKRFGKFSAVSDLSLEFYRGEVCTLLGHNGAGKTTTTFILVGMLEATSGNVTIEGLDNQIHIEEVRQNLGFCPQYDILYDELSVEEHLQLIAKMRHMDKQSMKDSVETILQLVSLVNDRNTLSKNLSGGMKRRLSIGISLINDPKVIILDEPTSGIDPYNRRLIWTIIRKLKGTGRCILLTTHFLEEADVLSDRIAIMSRGELQANGTPEFLKQQIDNEYRLIMDKQEGQCSSTNVSKFVKRYVKKVKLERESVDALVYGIKRGQSRQVERLIEVLDKEKGSIGIKSYGLTVTTIEDVFLRLIEEEEKHDEQTLGRTKQQQLDDQVFRHESQRLQGHRLFFSRLWALLIKRWHVSRRQLSLFFGFFLLSILLEIFCVAIIPTPEQTQSMLLQNERIQGAQVKLIPSIYNPQTIVTYSNENTTKIRSNLLNYLTTNGVTIDEISTNTISNYVQERYLQSANVFINKYQLSFATFSNSSSSLEYDAYFSTVNYHTMPTSLSVATNNLLQFYSNSTLKSIQTINQPILTTTKASTYIAEILSVLYCFEVFPVSLFSFLNSILATIFIGILLLGLISERLNHSKDLQLLTNLSRVVYWLSNWIFDFVLCLILCAIITIIVKIGAEANPKTDAEVHIYRSNEATGYFFLLFLLYTFASLPFAYVFSFIPRTSIFGFTNFFIVNVIANIIDAVINSFTIFNQRDPALIGPSQSYTVVTNIRWILAALLPSVNLKHALFNSQLHENRQCIGIFNIYIGTDFSLDERWESMKKPGIGAQLLIFGLQTIVWTLVLILIENRRRLGQVWQQYGPKIRRKSSVDRQLSDWDDLELDEDVRHERQMILNDPRTLENSSAIVVRDLIKQFEKRKSKGTRRQLYTAVDHLNFYVQKGACFGLLGANGAGKTTTFRMLINDIKATSGDILINGMNINKIQQQNVEIGFCPQFDWLINDLTVRETLILFARLKGVNKSDTSQMCENMMELFGLRTYEDQRVERLSGGNKRKVSAAIAFMANPALVFLDEPTTGLDAAAKRKLWKVIRSARDLGLTIIMTSHSMEECEALCTKLGIMKSGQFMCLGNLQHLKNRFSTGYAVQIKVFSDEDVNKVKNELINQFPVIEILDQHNEMLFCNVPFSSNNQSTTTTMSTSLASIFQILNRKKEERLIETYTLTQTTLEQIFVQLAGEDEDLSSDNPQQQVAEQDNDSEQMSDSVTVTQF